MFEKEKKCSGGGVPLQKKDIKELSETHFAMKKMGLY